MQLKNWEATIQTICDEIKVELKEAGKQRALTGWRAKLELEPHLLRPHQIDEIVREVRRRLDIDPQ